MNYAHLQFSDEFLDSLADPTFSRQDRQRFRRALQLLETNDQHPSLRVHPMKGDQEGVWSASASDQLRVTFERLAGGTKRLLRCSRHYR